MEENRTGVKELHEKERLKALMRYEILDTPPNGSFDNLTLLASVLPQLEAGQVYTLDLISTKSGRLNVKVFG